MKRRSSRARNPRGKRPRADRRAIPAIFVATPAEASFGLGKHAQAHIRTRRGGYRYLVWREGGQVRELYLGKMRNSRPTAGAQLAAIAAGGPRRRAARRVGQRKRGRK